MGDDRRMNAKTKRKKEREERRDSIFNALERLFFPKKKESTGIGWFFLLVILGLFGLIGYLVYDISQKTGRDVSQIAQAFTILPPSATPTPSPTPTPVPFSQDALQQSFNTMKSLTTMEAQFQSDATVTTNSQIDNRQQNLNIGVQGYVKGSTSGAPIISEMTVTEKGSGQTVQVGMAITLDGSHYIKQPNSSGQWDGRQMSQYPRIYENLPLDGSTFGFNFVETFFSERNALFSSIQRDTITEQRIEREGRSYIQYQGGLSIPDYFIKIDEDPTISPETKENTKKALNEANITVMLLVNLQSNVVEEVQVDATNLIQIDPQRAAELGYDSRYNLRVVGRFSSFDRPVEDLVPERL